ncbi:MAG: helix-turn-helix transcriptional regulator [Spiroplasma sp.]|nr:helix-turn-helix transcriptional regulator [Spiroplasma sp.]
MSIEVEIRRKRLRLGWTQVRLGQIVGVRQATISRIESNAKKTSWGLLERILIALNVDIKDINAITNNFILKESDFDLFLKLLLAHSEIKTNILYNPIHCARIIIDAYSKGHLNFVNK